MKLCVVALFCPMSIESSVLKTPSKTERVLFVENAVGLAAPSRKRSPHGKPGPRIKQRFHSRVTEQSHTMLSNETRENETKGNETGKNETKGNETNGNETGKNETKGNETNGNETGVNKTKENETESQSTTSNPSIQDTQYTIKSVENHGSGALQYLYAKPDGGVGTRGNADEDSCKWTLYTGPDGGVTVANVKWPDEHLSIIYETDVNDRSWKYVAETCSDDEKCYDEWEFYTLKGAAEGVMMYLIMEQRYLEEDCLSNKSPTEKGLWLFDPPLPANMIKGEKEDAGIIGNILR